MKKLLLLWLSGLAVTGFSARAQSIIDPNNTVVRLAVSTGGTNFGNIDLELFDQQKPETVRNFLMYVYSGGYSNILIHTLTQQKFLQAGHVQLHDPAGNLDFVTFDRTASFGSIESEYAAGPQLPNDFGTIALVPQTRFGFSAGSLDWIINLTNNSALNTNDGYVVFGRVVNTAGERGGTNLLRYFHSFTLFNNIRPVGLSGDTGENFAPPVTEYHNDRFPRTKEMFLVHASILHSTMVRDVSAPSVQVSEPAGDLTVETPGPLLFSGTAADNQRVARVLFDYGLPYQRFNAAGTVTWSSNVFLAPNTNRVFVRSLDDHGNFSTAVERRIVYPFVRVSFAQSGKGKVIGIADGTEFRLGATNLLQAKPAPGNYFLGWRGDIFSNDRAIQFVTDARIQTIFAYFSRTFLGLSNGTYNGLFFPGTNGPPRSAGFISINLMPNGAYVGRLNPIGASYQIRGQFDAFGISTISGFLGTNTLVLQLQLNPADESITGLYFNGRDLAEVNLIRVQKPKAGTPSPQAGNYSFIIRPTMDTNTEAGDGYGFGNVVINPAGKIKMTGTLGNDTSIKQNSAMVKGGLWPFFATAKGGREAVLGWVGFSSSNVFAANLKWWSPDFPGNTNQIARLDGGPYRPDATLNWVNGVITLSGDDLPAPISAGVMVNADHSFTVLANANNIQVGAPDAKGQVSGSFTHPVSGALTPLQGAVVQSSNIVAGFFGSGPGNGGFIIQRQP